MRKSNCVKNAPIWSYSCPHLPTFGLNTERYGVSVRIQSEYGKMRTRITPNTDTFYAVIKLTKFDERWDELKLKLKLITETMA